MSVRVRLPRAERREQILRAALKVFVRGGYHGTHVDHVIQEAGIARGTFYLHFKSKHEVFAALVDRMLAVFLDAALPDPEEFTQGDDPRATAERMLFASYRQVLATLSEHRALAQLFFDEAVGADKGFIKQRNQHFRTWHMRVSDRLNHFVKAGIARSDLDVEVFAEMVIGMVERLMRRYLFARKRPDLDRLARALVAIEMDGLTP